MRIPDAKLAIIGAGSSKYRNRVLIEIKRSNLEQNIFLLGFLDGEEKYGVFQKSKIILHPALYDSGGMAACEAMAWGLPGVSFDLPALRTYYPKGVIKTPCYDFNKFAENIVNLIRDKELYERIKEEAIAWAMEWDWDKRAQDILNTIKPML